GQAEYTDVSCEDAFAPHAGVFALRVGNTQQLEIIAAVEPLSNSQAGRSDLAVDVHLGLHAPFIRDAFMLVRISQKHPGQATAQVQRSCARKSAPSSRARPVADVYLTPDETEISRKAAKTQR